MDSIHDQNDAIINRINLQLARSRSILNSWRPQSSETSDQPKDEPVDEDDDDFANFGEKAGIGSKVVDDDTSAFPTKRSAPKEKLLEQLIGKKAANAKRKEEAHRSMSASKHAASKPLVDTQKPRRQQRAEESDEEEEGRAAAFRSKRSKKPPEQSQTAAEGVPQMPAEDREESGVANSFSSHAPVKAKQESSSKSRDAKAQKRKAGGSYLDELLSKKAKKKKSRKNGTV